MVHPVVAQQVVEQANGVLVGGIAIPSWVVAATFVSIVGILITIVNAYLHEFIRSRFIKRQGGERGEDQWVDRFLKSQEAIVESNKIWAQNIEHLNVGVASTLRAIEGNQRELNDLQSTRSQMLKAIETNQKAMERMFDRMDQLLDNRDVVCALRSDPRMADTLRRLESAVGDLTNILRNRKTP